MERQPPAISTAKYVFWLILTVLFLVLLFVMFSYLGFMGTAVIFGLALIIFFKVKYSALLKAWKLGKIPFSSRGTRTARTIPYYQPSQRSSYEQGYQQRSSQQTAARSHTSAAPKDVNPSEYEQPQAQYPEQMLLMM